MDTKQQPKQVPVMGDKAAPMPTNRQKKKLELFTVEQPTYPLTNLILEEATRQQLDGLLTKIKYQKVLYEDFGLQEVDPHGGRTAINFYGPPGTGKSMAAEAIAHHLGIGIIKANYAEIESKFVGETAKNIQTAFEKAKQTRSLLFFDEADSILGQRLTSVQQSTDHAVNVSRSVMLLALDNFTGVTIFATNLLSNYDTAFMRRILGHIEMKLPNEKLRNELWHAKIPQKLPLAKDVDIEMLAKQSAALSGGEILNAVINAASNAVRREGKTCQVMMQDFTDSIDQIKLAKIAIHQENAL